LWCAIAKDIKRPDGSVIRLIAMLALLIIRQMEPSHAHIRPVPREFGPRITKIISLGHPRVL